MKFTLMLFFVISSLFAQKLDEAAYNRGEMIYLSKGCSSCHGADAEGSTTYPKTGEQI